MRSIVTVLVVLVCGCKGTLDDRFQAELASARSWRTESPLMCFAGLQRSIRKKLYPFEYGHFSDRFQRNLGVDSSTWAASRRRIYENVGICPDALAQAEVSHSKRREDGRVELRVPLGRGRSAILLLSSQKRIRFVFSNGLRYTLSPKGLQLEFEAGRVTIEPALELDWLVKRAAAAGRASGVAGGGDVDLFSISTHWYVDEMSTERRRSPPEESVSAALALDSPERAASNGGGPLGNDSPPD